MAAGRMKAQFKARWVLYAEQPAWAIGQVQYVDSSTTLTPLWVVAGKRAHRPVR